ncbi:hypothetical protein HTZ97_04575 [Desulfuromonas acetoxidans]|uniref:Zinc resistance-associated protein n=1 Tax=Desulfuromonas acetoxidans (strain DSM 684 / 11070) TaxID=281689 RepID=Q1K114_DESA6|nr:hypothetical protein [Desulfuromonas acetoxidans]EAT16194.1 hypothetical protein Dace_1658 [Desulfuromonas acetoxidans DSM 684]MBF0645232.1 hypothetical protein [Desulfuromonas acetoxidans]NVD23024.1 hypothetical protein [Desulfuromonas acetoxidans]NVE15735.1 hypothetical protein [Desulfuromonas acetoxidans]
MMTRWKLWIVMVVVFVAGICVGVGGTGLFLRHKVTTVVEQGAPAISQLLVQRLSGRLDLSSDQEQQVTEILNSTQQQLAQLRRQIRPEVQVLIRQTVEEIRTDLSPAQQQEFDAFIQPFRERWQEHLSQQIDAEKM